MQFDGLDVPLPEVIASAADAPVYDGSQDGALVFADGAGGFGEGVGHAVALRCVDDDSHRCAAMVDAQLM
jgi:hypothetical protein